VEERVNAEGADNWIDWDAATETAGEPTGWRRDFRAVAAVMFATEDGPPDAERLNWLSDRVQNFFEEVGGKGAMAFRLSLFATTWVAPVWSLSLPRFRARDFDERVEILERWEQSPFGVTLFALKAFASMCYFEHPDVAAETNFDPRDTSDDSGRP